jgi:hypothetical protein
LYLGVTTLRDLDLYVVRHTKYAKYNDSEAAQRLADDFGFDFQGVKGRLSRASYTTEAKKALMKVLNHEAPSIPDSVKEQIAILERAKAKFDAWQTINEVRKGAFVSDTHRPFMRMDGYQLALELLGFWQPHAISVLNDGSDNQGFGRHEDTDPVYRQLWRSDITNHRKAEVAVHRDFNSVLAPNGYLLEVMGNHDNWLFEHWRTNTPQTAEATITSYMLQLESDNVLQFSRGIDENAVHLSDGLVWVHGVSSAKSAVSRARNALAYFMKNGRAKSVVQGHLHDAFQVDGSQVGFHGVTFTQNGMLRHSNPEWMKHPMNHWQMSITLCEYNPQTWEHEVHLVPFIQRKDMLVARFQGLEWAVKVDDSQPL